MSAMVELSGVTKIYGDVRVLEPLDLVIEKGSFTSLLGPSGCGKTTILNLIGGLDSPTVGKIVIGGVPVFHAAAGLSVPAERRNIGYVFQTYALWPHMTVEQNVAYPLKIRGVTALERHRQAREMLVKLELGHLAERYPFQISGGQQQRVAIARALIYRAQLMLLDEPLSNLDTQLRERARAWLAEVHAEFGLTTILVTHDQSEALSLSDRVILLDRGRVAQDGPAKDIYEAPRTPYAADFVGGANLIAATVVTNAGGDGTTEAESAGIRFRAAQASEFRTGDKVAIVVRPNRVMLTGRASVLEAASLVPFETRTALYQGASYEVVGDTPVGRLRVITERMPPAGALNAVIPWQDCRFVPAAPKGPE